MFSGGGVIGAVGAASPFSPSAAGRGRPAHAPLSPLKQGGDSPASAGRARPPNGATLSPLQQTAPGRGSLHLVRAGAAAFQFEWEAYRAENDFSHRTIQLATIVRTITKTFKHEWEMYRAETMAYVAGRPAPQQQQRQPGPLMSGLLQQAAEAGAETDVFDDGMRPGGYHPVQVGEKFKGGRYTALHPLGQGQYATVWMVMDEATGEERAMKVVKSAPNYTAAARSEVRLLTQIRDTDPEGGAQRCVRLLDSFEHVGPHGSHVCEVFEAMGDDLLTLIGLYNHRGIPLPVVRNLVRQTLEALDYLHTQCEIIHTDLKPENVMLTDPVKPREGLTSVPDEVDLQELEPRLLSMGCKIVDFGNACHADRQHSENIQTRPYRSPEVILGAGYDNSADIWSLACMVFELVTGDLLFDPRASEASKDEDHLAQMVELLPHIPPEVATSGKYGRKFFTADGRLRRVRRLQDWPLERVLTEKYRLPLHEALALQDFLLAMLEFDPSRRATAAEMLAHPWLQDPAEQQQQGLAAQQRPTSPRRERWHTLHSS